MVLTFRTSLGRRQSIINQKVPIKSSKSILQNFIRSGDDNDLNFDYIEILKKELSKENMNMNASKKEALTKRSRNNKNLTLTSGLKLHVYEYSIKKENDEKNIIEDTSKLKNTNLILIALKQMQNFIRYQKLNFLNDETVIETIPYFKYKFYQKYDIISDEINEGQRFYCLINGKILIKNIPKKLSLSMSKKKTQILNMNSFLEDNLENEYFREEKENTKKKHNSNMYYVLKANFGSDFLNKMNISEDDKEDNYKMLYKPGECFGDWDILEGKTNKNSLTVCLEDSHMFYLEKKEFIEHFSKGILRGEHEKKEFIKINIHPLKSTNKFDLYYKKISTVIIEKDEILYSENSHGEFFYLIYQGGCRIQKFVGEKNLPSRNKKYHEDNKLIDVLQIEKGLIVGLEAAFEPDNLYKYTLKATQNFTVLFKIKFSDLKQNTSIKEFLFEYYKRQNEMLVNTYTKYKCIHGNIKPIYNKIKINSDNFVFDSKKCEELILNRQQNQKRENDFKIDKMMLNRNKLLSKSTEDIGLNKSKQSCNILPFSNKKNTTLNSLNQKNIVSLFMNTKMISKLKKKIKQLMQSHFISLRIRLLIIVVTTLI